MVEPVITNLEIPDHDGEYREYQVTFPLKYICDAEEELEPLDSPPPSYIILCFEWVAMKLCGYSPLDKEELQDTGKKKIKTWTKTKSKQCFKGGNNFV